MLHVILSLLGVWFLNAQFINFFTTTVVNILIELVIILVDNYIHAVILFSLVCE